MEGIGSTPSPGSGSSLLIPLHVRLAKFQEKWGPQNKIWEKKRGEGNSLPVLYPHTLVIFVLRTVVIGIKSDRT